MVVYFARGDLCVRNILPVNIEHRGRGRCDGGASRGDVFFARDGKGCPIDWYFTGQPRKFWPCAVTGPLWQLCHLETIQSPPTRQAWSCIDRREGPHNALSRKELGVGLPVAYGRHLDGLKAASWGAKEALGAARGRLEAVLEAVPRVRCKIRGFHENDVFGVFNFQNSFKHKKMKNCLRFATSSRHGL